MRAFVGALAALALTSALAQSPPENTGPNKNIVRRSDGSAVRAGRRDDWSVLTHPDGSRTLIGATIDGRGRTSTSTIVRIDAASQPQVAYRRSSMLDSSPVTLFQRDAWPEGLRAWTDAVTHLPGTRSGRGPGNRALGRAGVARWARGRFAYTALNDSRARGTEDFHVTVHTDGSRSLLMWHDVFARHTQFTVALHIDALQRPQEAFVSYWTAQGYKGSTLIQIDGARLRAQTRGPAGDQSHEIEVPERFSIGTHPVAGDGWHTFNCDAAVGQRGQSKVYSMEASADLSKPALGQITTLDCENVGTERVTVPAGSFDTLHYRLAGVSDVWITRDDRLMVKFVAERLDRSYTLIELQRSR